MIFQSFILDNLVFLCMKIMNSIVVVGLYYGFLTTFSIGPSYLFLLRARLVENGTEKKISATTGFITGQLIMFISIYYAPLYLALGRPHTITVIALPYLLFQFFGNNHKNFWNYGYKNPNSIRNLSIQRIFFQNLLFQLLNPLFLPSSILIRLVNLYLFRCNNKFLFLTSSFIGWIIGHTFFMKWIEFLLVCIQPNNLIKSNVRIQANKDIRSEFINSMFQIFLVLLFLTCLYYLGRIPLPFFSNKLSEMKENNEFLIYKKGKKIDVKINLQRTQTKQKRSKKKYIFPSISKKEKNLYKIDEERSQLGFVKKPFVNILFNFKRWNRPFRYIKNNRFENLVKNEISEFFFFTCESDGRERISLTYPPNLSTFHKMMETKIYLFTRYKISYEELFNYWNYTNGKKRNKLSNEFINRAKVMDKEFISMDILENRIRLCNDEIKTKYLTKIYDPFLNGPFRGRIKNGFTISIQHEKTYKKNNIFINKIKSILLYKNIYNNKNYSELKEKIKTFDRKLILTTFFFFSLISKFSKKLVSSLKLETLDLLPEHERVNFNSEEEKKLIIKILFAAIRTDLNEKTIVNKNRTQCIRINEISKKVPRWSYKFIDELEQLDGKIENFQIRSRKAKRVVILTNKYKIFKKSDTYNDTGDIKKKKNELALIRYYQQSDFRRDIIKGSIRAQRRKTVTWKFFQKRVHSPLFLDKIEKPLFLSPLFFSFDSFKSMKIFFMLKIWMRKKTEFPILGYIEKKTKESSKKEEKKKKENEERKRIEIAETWDSILFAQVIRGVLLITQSIFRKYILLPSLIILKNIVRLLFFQFPEWSEDYRDWKREIYIKCTYNGIQLSEREFPKKWLTDGIQIKILFPFRLKPWHKSKPRCNEKKKDSIKKNNFCFLTVWGMEVELPFSGSSQNRFSFFEPLLKELKKKTKQFQFFTFLIRKVLSEKLKLFLNILMEKAKWTTKNILESFLFLTKKRKQLFKFLFIQFKFKKIDELSKSKKDSTVCKNNPKISEATISNKSINSANCSLTKKKIKDLNTKRKKVIKKIEKMKKEEKKRVLVISETKMNSNKRTYDSKRIQLEKKFLQILQKRINVELRSKSHYFLIFFMKNIYTDIVLYIICIPRIQIQLFIESTKKFLKKSIYDNEVNAERTYKINQSLIRFISILRKYIKTTNTNSDKDNCYDVSVLSQAYVFFKLLQTKRINLNLYKLRSVFQYQRNFFFLKNEIKDSLFGTQGIFYSNLKQKNPLNSVINQWTNWLKGHYYQYDLSKSRWSRLILQKWRNRMTECHIAQKNELTKSDSYEKSRLIFYKEQQVDTLKKKMIKQYRYDLFSYNFINYAEKKDSYIYDRYRFQSNKNQVISSNYNMYKKEFFDIIGNIFIKNYIAEDTLIDMEKNLDRKSFDWMGINREILNRYRSISNPEFWFFSKFVIFYNAYRGSSQIIPIKLLFLPSNVNQNISENKNNIIRKKIIDIFKPSKKKESLELELEIRNRTKGEYPDRINLELSHLNREKDIENLYVRLGIEKNSKGIKKKKAKNKMEVQLNFLLRNFLTLHFNWNNFLGQNILNNVKIYCLLIRLKNFREMTITSIQRGELGLDIMMIQNQKNLTLPGLKKKKNNKFMKKEIFVIRPVRLSRKNNKQFLMYQTMGLSLIHKNKSKIYKKYPEKIHVNKKNFDKSITRTRDLKITEKKEKDNFDLLIPENILSAKRRRELRILICFNANNIFSIPRNTIFYNENKVQNCFQILTKKIKYFEKDKKKLMNLKIFLWPKYRLEDLSCINRYWFNTHNGSRFSIVRIHMYPQSKIR
uniref:hypothetical protein Ycf1 n=1 Tax=Strongylodon macrobotrys TaxID=167626 RepID=UPI0021FADF23|nr:hypothetical protein Ycf1 [Strongylodon macrobotrys]UXL85850.1 hypothetical protein Ycf1 [Strongylodon macrobotrys]